MNSIDAIRLMVRHYPGGMTIVAARLGKSPKTLEKELRDDSGHKLGLVDAGLISSMCIDAASPHCRAYANSIAMECGGFVELPVRDMARRQDVRMGAADMLRECSESISALTTALADERISDNERRSIERELAELVQQIQTVQQGVRAIHAASKPAMVREVA